MADNVFETLFAQMQGNPEVKSGVLVVIEELKKEAPGGLEQAEITKVVTAIEGQLNSPAAALAYSPETLATSRALLNQLKSLPPQALAEMDTEEKANAFLDNFRAVLEAENAEEARRRGDAVSQNSPNMIMSIIAMILVACGMDEKQVNEMLGLAAATPAAPAADAQQAQAAETQQPTPAANPGGPAQNAADLDGMAHRLTNNPNGFTRAEKIIADGDDAKRHEALIAQRIARVSPHLHDLMIKQPDVALASTIETRISQQAVTGEKDSRRSYYAAAAEHNALDTILTQSGGTWGNYGYAIRDLELDNYTGSDVDRNRASHKMSARKAEISEDPVLTYLGLEAKFDNGHPFEKGVLNGAPEIKGNMDASQFAREARSFGQYAAEQQLLTALKQGVYHTYDTKIMATRKQEIDTAVTALEDKVKGIITARETLLAEAGFHEAREELNKKLAADPTKGRGHAGYMVAKISGQRDTDINARAEDAVRFHADEKERISKLADKRDLELAAALQNLKQLYREQGEIHQQVEYAKGEGTIMGEVKTVVDDVKGAIEQADKDARDAAKAEADRIAAAAARQQEENALKQALGGESAAEVQSGDGAGRGSRAGAGGYSAADAYSSDLPAGVTQVMSKGKDGEIPYRPQNGAYAGEPRYKLSSGIVIAETQLGKLQQLAHEREVPLDRLMGDKQFMQDFKYQTTLESKVGRSERNLGIAQYADMLSQINGAQQSTRSVYESDPMKSSVWNKVSENHHHAERERLNAYSRAFHEEANNRRQEMMARVETRMHLEESASYKYSELMDQRIGAIRLPWLQQQLRDLNENLDVAGKVGNSLTALQEAITNAINDPSRSSRTLAERIGELKQQAQGAGLTALEGELANLGRSLTASALNDAKDGTNTLTKEEMQQLEIAAKKLGGKLEADVKGIRDQIAEVQNDPDMPSKAPVTPYNTSAVAQKDNKGPSGRV